MRYKTKRLKKTGSWLGPVKTRTYRPFLLMLSLSAKLLLLTHSKRIDTFIFENK